MKRLKVILIWIGVVALVLVALNFVYKALMPALYDKGIDVSHHNGAINWTHVDSDIRFAYIKATEGGDWVDENYAYNSDQARARGIKVGAYHFFTERTLAEDQYRNFVAHAGDIDLIPMVDIEDMDFTDQMLPNLRRLCELLEAHYGVKPIIYADVDVLLECFWFLKDYKWWIGARNANLAYIKLFCTVWQYSETMPVSGIDGNVDRDYARLSSLLLGKR